mmetsp:Transcript_131014/g.184660  ORF Transcript_131014/g.184660 Transcript_131014/m.184660 type:complete len:202 (+) Transcript_131014:81-686(+)
MASRPSGDQGPRETHRSSCHGGLARLGHVDTSLFSGWFHGKQLPVVTELDRPFLFLVSCGLLFDHPLYCCREDCLGDPEFPGQDHRVADLLHVHMTLSIADVMERVLQRVKVRKVLCHHVQKIVDTHRCVICRVFLAHHPLDLSKRDVGVNAPQSVEKSLHWNRLGLICLDPKHMSLFEGCNIRPRCPHRILGNGARACSR